LKTPHTMIKSKKEQDRLLNEVLTKYDSCIVFSFFYQLTYDLGTSSLD
jgi:hypothetical protein